MKKIILISAMLTLTLNTFSQNLPTITVKVVGKPKADAVEALEVHIHEKGENSNISNSKATEVQNTIIKELVRLGYDESEYSLKNTHSGIRDDEYYTRKLIVVKVYKDMNREELVDILTKNGASGVHNYSPHPPFYGQETEDSLPVPETLEEAIKLAKDKADKLAMGFNGRVGRIVEVRELHYNNPNSDVIAFDVTYELIIP